MKLTPIYEPAAEGGFVCRLEEMPSVQTQGETMEEARANLQDALQLSLTWLRDTAEQRTARRRLSDPDEILAAVPRRAASRRR